MKDAFLTRFRWAIVRFFESQIQTLITERILVFARGLKDDGVIPSRSSGDHKHQSSPSSPSSSLVHPSGDRRECIGD